MAVKKYSKKQTKYSKKHSRKTKKSHNRRSHNNKQSNNKRRLNNRKSKNNIRHKQNGGFGCSAIASVREPGFNVPALNSVDGLSIPDMRATIYRPNCEVDNYQAMVPK